MLTEDLRIYRDTFELAKYVLFLQRNIARDVRYGLFQEIINLLCKATDYIFTANSDKSQRFVALCRYIEVLGGVRTRIRLLGECRYIPVKKQNYIALTIDKCLKQAVGWRNATHGQSLQGKYQTESANIE